MTKTYSDICSAIKSLNPENRYAFISTEFIKNLEKLNDVTIYKNYGSGFERYIPDSNNLRSFSKYYKGEVLHNTGLIEKFFANLFYKDNNDHNYNWFSNWFSSAKEQTAAIKLAQNIRQLANEASFCLNTDATKLEFIFLSHGNIRLDSTSTGWHKDTENSSDKVRLIYTFKGSKTNFKNHITGEEETIPQNHMAVFIEGNKFGAEHTSPIEGDTSYNCVYNGFCTMESEDYERFTVAITGKAEHLTQYLESEY